MRARLAAAVSCLAITVAAHAQGPEVADLSAAMQRLCTNLSIEGAGLTVVRDDGELHRSVHGVFTSDRVVPVASASKWLTVATLLSLVDAGLLDLDAPVARHVPEFDRPDKRVLTLRQCLSCTSGLPAQLDERLRGLDMAKFAALAADASLRGDPGASFRYGGVGFQVAAIAAERATGKSWHDVFAERIAGPLGLTHTSFGTLVPPGGEAGTAALPWAGGGAVSTLQDYGRFVQMLVGKGRLGGVRVLSEASVATMLRDHVAPRIEVHSGGLLADGARYGLGTWLEPLADGAFRASDPGAFGFTPWLDTDLGIGGVLALRDRVDRVLPQLRRIQDQVRQVALSPAFTGTDTTVALTHGGRERRYHLHVPPNSTNVLGLPLVVVLHGGGGSGEHVRESTGFPALADRERFVAVFPDGTGPLRGRLLTWNSGGIQTHAAERDVDDTGFLRAVVADVSRRVAIDPARVFAVGHSNGGMMCHRLAREAADLFTGIAVVGGAMNFTDADSSLPIAAMMVHGTDDQHVRIEGGTPARSLGKAGNRSDASLRAAVDYYVARNGLRGYPVVADDGAVKVETWSAAKAEGAAVVPVRVVTLQGGGHAWPGTQQTSRQLADTPFPWPATRAIWEFFAGLGSVPRPRGGEPPIAPR